MHICDTSCITIMCVNKHTDIIMMTSWNENIFRVTGPLWGESTGHWWIPLPKASEAELWCFLWSALRKRLNKQSKHRWCDLRRHRTHYDVTAMITKLGMTKLVHTLNFNIHGKQSFFHVELEDSINETDQWHMCLYNQRYYPWPLPCKSLIPCIRSRLNAVVQLQTPTTKRVNIIMQFIHFFA